MYPVRHVSSGLVAADQVLKNRSNHGNIFHAHGNGQGVQLLLQMRELKNCFTAIVNRLLGNETCGLRCLTGMNKQSKASQDTDSSLKPIRCLESDNHQISRNIGYPEEEREEQQQPSICPKKHRRRHGQKREGQQVRRGAVVSV